MKLILSFVAVMAVASAAVAGPILGVTVDSYSGRLMATYDAPMSIDGDTGTAWYSELSGTPWIIYDLGSVNPVTDVTITTAAGNFRKLATAGISVSVDGVTYTAAGNFDVSITDGAETTFSLGGASAQYVRLDGVQAYYSNWSPQYATPGTASDGKYAICYAEIDFVPEPATLSLLFVGGALLLRRKRA